MGVLRTLSEFRSAWFVSAALLVGLVALLASEPAAGQSAPSRPASVTVTRTQDAVNASWDAPAGAARYHVTYSDDYGGSWLAAAGPDDNHAAASISLGNIDTQKTYVVAVRAGNAHGWSGWRNSAPSLPVGLPDAVASISVTRADGVLTASWPAVTGADKYHVTYSANGGNSWAAASVDHASASITISVANGDTYIVAVRAGNAHGWSGATHRPSALGLRRRRRRARPPRPRA